MTKLHVISDDSYFLTGMSSVSCLPWFSYLKVSHTGTAIDKALICSISSINDDVTVVNVASGKMRRDLLILLGVSGKKVLVMARFNKSQSEPLLPHLIKDNSSAKELLAKASHLMLSETYSLQASLINSTEFAIPFLLEKGVVMSDISSMINLCEKSIAYSRKKIVERIGLRGKDKPNMLLCCDMLRMFSFYDKHHS